MVNHYFLDTSALAKRYIPEIGTPWINRITTPSKNNILLLLSQLTWVELQSAISRRQRENTLTLEESQILRTRFQSHWNTDYHIITVDQTLLNLATELIKKHPLRAYDAVQLASALIIQPSLSNPATTPFTFVSADDRLLTIAQLEGLTTLNPNRA
jgi:uncharacterized protein